MRSEIDTIIGEEARTVNPMEILDAFTLTEAGQLNQVSNLVGEWEEIKVVPDSGACDFVAPLKMAKHIPWKKGAKTGVKYKAASGQELENKGEKVVEAFDVNGNRIASTWQGANVVKPLAGIRRMVKAGNRVIFEEDEWGINRSRIESKKTGIKVPIDDVNAGYEFSMWIKVGKKGKPIKKVEFGEADENDDMDVGELSNDLITDKMAKNPKVIESMKKIKERKEKSEFMALMEEDGTISFTKLVEAW